MSPTVSLFKDLEYYVHELSGSFRCAQRRRRAISKRSMKNVGGGIGGQGGEQKSSCLRRQLRETCSQGFVTSW
jgi:hypothetical protein